MIEIAGITLSGLSLATDLYNTIKRAREWKRSDLEVDRLWLDTAIKLGHLEGPTEQYRWIKAAKIPRAEMEGTHAVIVAHDKENKTIYRITRGDIVLTKRIVAK